MNVNSTLAHFFQTVLKHAMVQQRQQVSGVFSKLFFFKGLGVLVRGMMVLSRALLENCVCVDREASILIDALDAFENSRKAILLSVPFCSHDDFNAGGRTDAAPPPRRAGGGWRGITRRRRPRHAVDKVALGAGGRVLCSKWKNSFQKHHSVLRQKIGNMPAKFANFLHRWHSNLSNWSNVFKFVEPCKKLVLKADETRRNCRP